MADDRLDLVQLVEDVVAVEDVAHVVDDIVAELDGTFLPAACRRASFYGCYGYGAIKNVGGVPRSRRFPSPKAPRMVRGPSWSHLARRRPTRPLSSSQASPLR